MEVKAKVSIGGEGGEVREGVIEYNFGENLSETVELFGDEVVHSNAVAQMKIGLQARMRAYLTEGKPVEQLAAIWKPGVQLPKSVDPVAAVKAAFSTMTDEERAELIAKIQSMAQA